ncbi:Bicarbonate transporter BicA [Piscirickettsia salmonis]|uniref:Bicarbonate transporter BicA n=1 Tax=Piscirickettsia salmonis TaxID=1238 RepID=A0AAC9EV10_PISSA|nr:SulP family inorganic anion transporter [Piscirickettsia salmonis]ALB22846.1 Bicarbonate transporter BicA [Piscirickettsia salmonis]QGN98550.1 Bicarbonate transporter BicA [Piscirickettsia salmonis]QGO02169.1 Bicarbonate transporter BicA [Piscirickettsia salmonis]QGO12858.1 Bicarbonate transporter BicA [Piscirickettsia salmonis]QGO19900.1 Bicarbonate transporter BicA [Piscirickettsia salmonis]
MFGGITAAIIALPVALAFGLSSGMGPMAGLYSAVCVGLFAALFGGTPAQISGPTGPMTVVMAATLINLNDVDAEAGLAMGFTVVVLAGCFQILFGLAKLGRYITLVPYPVISGFMSGVGVIIIILQLPPLFGYPLLANPWQTVLNIADMLAAPNYTTFYIGLIALVIAFFWQGRLNQFFPAYLLALIIGTVIYLVFFKNNADMIAVIGNIPSGIPKLHWPTFDIPHLRVIITSALLLAVLGAVDSLFTSLVADNITHEHHHSDRELIGQGLGNMASGLIGGLPGAGATMRTVASIQAGGSTSLAGVVHSLILLAVVLGAGHYFSSIPHAVLAGILIKVGTDIIDWKFIVRLYRLPVFSSILMLIVLLLTVFVDLISAVFVGVFIANLVTIDRLSHIQLDGISLSDGIKNRHALLSSEADKLRKKRGQIVLFRLVGAISFGVARQIKKQISDFKEHQVLVLDLSRVSLVGVTSIIMVDDIVRAELSKNNKVYIIMNEEGLDENLEKISILKKLKQEYFVKSLDELLRKC